MTSALGFHEGMQVYKPEGYPYPGTVVAVFQTLDKKWRFVVESLRSPGMLHIFSSNQLAPAPMEYSCGECRHSWHKHETEIKWNEETTLRECIAPMGMGDWCGCKETVPVVIKSDQERLWA